MDVLKTAVSFITFQRFYRYILKRVLGGILQPEFRMDQIDVQLFRGELQLADVRLNVSRINNNLKAQEFPIRLLEGEVSRLRLRIPWRRVLSEPCKVYLNHIRLRVSLDSNFSAAQGTGSESDIESEKVKASNATLALIELVRQVLMKIEACVERITVEVDDGSDFVFETRDIVVYSEAGGVKRISIGDSEVTLGSRRESVVALTPMTAEVDISDAADVRVSVQVNSVTLASGHRRTLRDLMYLFSRLKRPSERSLAPSVMYESVIEDELSEPFVSRPWYEEIYQVIEGEVLKSSPNEEEFMDVQEELLDLEEDLSANMELIKIGKIDLEIDRIRLSALGVEVGTPGLSVVLQKTRIEANGSFSNIQSEIEDFAVFFDPVNTGHQMFVSTISNDSDDASSVYESVVDSEDSVGVSETFDLSDDEVRESDHLDDSDYNAQDRVRDWESLFFESDTEALALAMQGRTGEDLFVSFADPSGTVLVERIGMVLKKSENSVFELTVGSNVNVTVTPEIIANFGLFSSIIGACMQERKRVSNLDRMGVPLTFSCPGLRVLFELGNGHRMKFESQGAIIFDSGTGSVDGLKVFAGNEPAASLSNITLAMSLIEPPNPSTNAPSDCKEKEGGIWTAVGKTAKVRSEPPAPPTERTTANVWDLPISKRITCYVSSLAVCESPVTFLDLQLKAMSLVDQIGMASLALGLKPAVASPPLSCVDIIVDSTRIDAVTLCGGTVRVVQSGSGPLLGVRVETVSVGSPDNLLARSIFENSSVPTIDVSMEVTAGASLSQINVQVLARNLRAELSKEYEKIFEFFVPNFDISPLHAAPLITAPPRPTVTTITLRIEDSFIVCPYGAVVLVDGLESSSGILSTVNKESPVALSFKAEKLSLALAKETESDRNFLPGFDLVTNLKQRGHIELISVCGVKGLVEWKESLKSRLSLDLHVTQVRVDLKADTFDGLASWCGLITEDVKRIVDERANREEEESQKISLPPYSQPVPAIVIKEDFVESRTGGRGGSRFGRPQDFVPAPAVLDSGARWLVDPSSVKVLHDHLTNREQKHKRKLQEARREIELHANEISSGFEQFSFNVSHVGIFIVDGSDWASSEFRLAGMVNQRRPSQSFVCLETDNLSIDIVRSKKDDCMNLLVSAGDLRVRDGVIGSVYQHVLCQWGTRMGPDAVSAWFSKREAGESKGGVIVAPVCVTVDQDTLEFVNSFVNRVVMLGLRRGGAGVDLNINDDFDSDEVPTSEDADNIELRPIVNPVERLMKNFQVSSIDVELNYKAKRLSLRKLRKGDALQLLNIVPLLEGLRVCLREVRMVDVPDIDDLSARLLSAWSRDINKAQILKSIASVKPLKSFTNLSSSITELVRQPLRQIRRKDGRVSRGLLRGVTAFVRTLTIESLNLADVVVSSAQSALEFVDSHTSSGGSAVEQLDCVLEDDDGEDLWVPVERGARERALDPASAIEGLRTGSDSLLRGVNVTLARGAPGFILQPAIGAAEAVSVVIRGARSTVDAGRHHAETERKYKGPHVHSELLRGP